MAVWLSMADNILYWYQTILFTIALIVFWRSLVAAASLVMASISSASSDADAKGEEWKALFYYVPPISLATQENENEMYNQPFFHELHTALKHYREMADNIVKQLSLSHEIASRTEQLLFPNHNDRNCNNGTSAFLSCKIEQKITKTADLLEQNVFVLERLLKPFPVNFGMSPLHNTQDLHSHRFDTLPPSHNNLSKQQTGSSEIPMQLARYIPPYKPSQSNTNGEEEPYDTASHIITHLARDWTLSGASIRKDTHGWIVEQLLNYHHQLDLMPTNHSQLSPVLIPGAGMARLAFDIAFTQSSKADTETDDELEIEFYPFAVEAVDNSLVMATAAYHVLHHHNSNNEEGDDNMNIYPIAADPFINEVDTQRRWEQAVFPEDNVSNQLHGLNMLQSTNQPKLSYVIGNFVSIYASPSKHGLYGSIATCFFIDTATNIYEYIITIQNLLRSGGVWINLGPVQWHSNAQLQPSANELKDLIMLSGFEVIHWEISDKLMAYRHPDDIKIGTRAESYRPLKFVAVFQPGELLSTDAKADSDGLLSSLEELRRVTGRKSMVQNIIIDDNHAKDNAANIQI